MEKAMNATHNSMASSNGSAPMSLKEMAKSIMDKAGISREYQSLVVIRMSSYLKDIGLTKWENDGFGGRWTSATEKGREIGIRLEDRLNKKGDVYKVLVFSDKVMEILTSKLPDFMDEIYGRYGTDYVAQHKPEYADRYINGEHIRIIRHFADHRFTDEEISALVKGDSITIPYNSINNNAKLAFGHLQEISDGSGIGYSAIRYYRFVPTFAKEYVGK